MINKSVKYFDRISEEEFNDTHAKELVKYALEHNTIPIRLQESGIKYTNDNDPYISAIDYVVHLYEGNDVDETWSHDQMARARMEPNAHSIQNLPDFAGDTMYLFIPDDDAYLALFTEQTMFRQFKIDEYGSADIDELYASATFNDGNTSTTYKVIRVWWD